MSPEIGPLTFKASDPMQGITGTIMSEATAIKIDEAVKSLVQSAYDRAKQILVDNNTILEEMTQALLDKETISHGDIKAIVEKHS